MESATSATRRPEPVELISRRAPRARVRVTKQVNAAQGGSPPGGERSTNRGGETQHRLSPLQFYINLIDHACARGRSVARSMNRRIESPSCNGLSKVDPEWLRAESCRCQFINILQQARQLSQSGNRVVLHVAQRLRVAPESKRYICAGNTGPIGRPRPPPRRFDGHDRRC